MRRFTTLEVLNALLENRVKHGIQPSQARLDQLSLTQKAALVAAIVTSGEFTDDEGYLTCHLEVVIRQALGVSRAQAVSINRRMRELKLRTQEGRTKRARFMVHKPPAYMFVPNSTQGKVASQVPAFTKLVPPATTRFSVEMFGRTPAAV